MVNAEETEELDNESFSLLEKPPTNGVISNKVDTNDEIQEDDEQRWVLFMSNDSMNSWYPDAFSNV